jgi:hypothetical protein
MAAVGASGIRAEPPPARRSADYREGSAGVLRDPAWKRKDVAFRAWPLGRREAAGMSSASGPGPVSSPQPATVSPMASSAVQAMARFGSFAGYSRVAVEGLIGQESVPPQVQVPESHDAQFS